MPGNTSPFPEIRGFLSQGVAVYFPYPETDIIEVFENITSGDDHEKSRFTETRIFSILKEADAGMKVKTVCRKHGIATRLKRHITIFANYKIEAIPGSHLNAFLIQRYKFD